MRPDDHEAAMARADLYKMANYSFKLFKMIKDGDQLEGWVQAKITKAADYVASVFHYMEYEMKFSEYGSKIENSDMYSEAVKAEFRQKLVEAKQKLAKLKKVAMDESGMQLPYDPDGESAPPPKGKDGKYPVIVAGPNKGIRWGDINPKTKQKAMGPTNPALAEPAKKPMREGKKGDGNLANNAKPYDKVTRGDVIAGRLGKDEMGGKAKKVKEEMKAGDTKKSSTGGTIEKTKTGIKHTAKDWDGAEHGESPSKVKQKSAAEKKADKAKEIKLPKHKGNTWGMKGGEKFGKKMEAADKCNHTPKGKSCPVHGLKECGSMMEASKSKNLKQQAAIAIAKKKAA